MNRAETSSEISPVEAARQIGLYDLNRIYCWLRVGRLEGRKVDGQWQVSRESVERLKATRKTVIA
jgi:hypothetical protein